MKADELILELKQRKYFYNAMNSGNVKIWFSLYDEKLADEYNLYKINDIELPFGHFTSIDYPINGWMYYWQHFGGRCSSTAAFITILPNNKNEAKMEFEYKRELYNASNIDNISFSINDQALEFFNHGLCLGLRTILSHPLGDIIVRLNNFIIDNADYHPKGFMNLGQYLVENLTIELYKQGIIKDI